MSVSYEEVAKSNGKPLIVFIKHYDSHNFTDRMILVNDEVKIGRAVARLKSAPNNAIFDCKVLSRNHAIISYIDKKFILKDTKSSNGTYVNNTRVNKEDSEYGEREIFSNDIVKFGVEVLEHGLTHGCIVTQVKLFHPDGTEAKLGKTVEQKTNSTVSVRMTNESFFRLDNYIIDAIYREGNIRHKTEELKFIMDQIANATEVAWKAMLNEERLLDKISLYESEIRIYKENLPEDSIKAKYVELQGQLAEIELKHKEILQNYIEDKNNLNVKLSEANRKFNDASNYSKKLETDLANYKDSHLVLLNKFDDRNKEFDKVNNDLLEESGKRQDFEKRLNDSQREVSNLKNSLNSDVKPSTQINGVANQQQNGIKKSEDDEEFSEKKESDEQVLPKFNDTAIIQTPASPPTLQQTKSSSSFHITNTGDKNSSVANTTDSRLNNQPEDIGKKTDCNNSLSFHDEYRSLQSKLEMIEQEMNICKSEQITVKSENKMLKAKLQSVEEELRNSQEKCSRMEALPIQPTIDTNNVTSSSSPPNPSQQDVQSPSKAITCSCQQSDRISLAYNMILIPAMVLLLALMYSIFAFFNPSR